MLDPREGCEHDIEAGDPIEPDDIFRIYSMTKPITSGELFSWDRSSAIVNFLIGRYESGPAIPIE